MAQRKTSPNDRKQPSPFTRLCVSGAFVITVGLLTLIGLLFPLRPSYSEEEKRELTKFPAFSFAALFNGDFFDGVNQWYSDTFPLRGFWVGENSKLKSLYGFSGQQIHGEIIQGDEIPDPVASDAQSAVAVSQPEESSALASAAESIPANDADLAVETMGGVLVAGDSGYEFYNFVTDTANQYAAAVNRMANLLDGKAKVYDMIVPTSVGVTLPDNIKKDINSSDQGKAIDYMTSLLSSKVTSVEPLHAMLLHRDEYLYFRTDHHWTQRGAWYGYAAYARAAGFAPVALSACEQKDYEGFLGSFYTDTGKNPTLAAHPDTVETFTPPGDTRMVVTQRDGTEYVWPVVGDVSESPATLKYGAFIAGDNPYTVIENRSLTDGSACLVIKESFGNALVPFLTANYQTVYVVDYRYYAGSVTSLVAEKGITDVLFINNISATRNSSLVSRLGSLS